jgi:hexokinase
LYRRRLFGTYGGMALDLAPFTLDDRRLDDMRRGLRERIAEGLASDGRAIACIPAWFPPPPEGLSGRAIVLDTGGTNMRAALITLDGRRSSIDAGPLERRLPVREQRLDHDGFFDVQAALIAELDLPKDLPVGYCFSYPSDVHASRDAKLIRWTKGIDVPGVEGAFVGRGLMEAMERRGFRPPHVHVLNDTVASMLGASSRAEADQRPRMIGLIAGTGSNMSAFFSPPAAAKLAYGPMAVNLESGNFDPPHLTEWDRAVDRASDNPGAQRFEKAVSGHYLPYLFDAVLPGVIDPAKGAKALVELRDIGGPEDGRALAGAILSRAADMVAAALAAVAGFYDGKTAIVAEGSLFWRDPEFSRRCRATLDRLTGPGRTEIQRLENANLIGSACAARMT